MIFQFLKNPFKKNDDHYENDDPLFPLFCFTK